MKLYSLLTIVSMTEAQRRPRLQMEKDRLAGRMVNQDRYIYQWPQCEDMTCGKNKQQIKEASKSIFYVGQSLTVKH